MIILLYAIFAVSFVLVAAAIGRASNPRRINPRIHTLERLCILCVALMILLAIAGVLVELHLISR